MYVRLEGQTALAEKRHISPFFVGVLLRNAKSLALWGFRNQNTLQAVTLHS